jgi:hypothetical protein
MKYRFITVCLALVLTAFGGAELSSFHAFPAVDHCRLVWQTGTESNLALFVIERSSDGSTFAPAGQLNAKGSYSDYEFTDSRPLAADVTRIFYYRLKMVDNDGATHYSEVQEVSLTFSAVQHTWGSIKAMFR